jgi:pyridoxamine 5'-phosphate oxidase
MNIDSLRREYTSDGLSEASINPDPIKQFRDWFLEAVESKIEDVNAMTLASSSVGGIPSARIVLLKHFDEKGFTFFTNYDSRKGAELETNPFGAILFYWKELNRQVRIEGKIEKVTESESDEYFNSRPVESQISAIISKQSFIIDSRKHLENKLAEFKKSKANIQRPNNWGGFRLVPDHIEFWQGRPNRLHDRILYQGSNEKWKMSRLAP